MTPEDQAAIAILTTGGIVTAVGIALIVAGTVFRFGPQVWKSYGRYYAKSQGRLYRGTTYKLWTPVHQVIPGVLYVLRNQKPFYIDEEGFEPVWKLGFWPRR